MKYLNTFKRKSYSLWIMKTFLGAVLAISIPLAMNAYARGGHDHSGSSGSGSSASGSSGNLQCHPFKLKKHKCPCECSYIAAFKAVKKGSGFDVLNIRNVTALPVSCTLSMGSGSERFQLVANTVQGITRCAANAVQVVGSNPETVVDTFIRELTERQLAHCQRLLTFLCNKIPPLP